MFRLILFGGQKVSKKLLIPEGDLCARGRPKTTVKAEANAQSSRFLSFAAITDRNQPSDNDFLKFKLLLTTHFSLQSLPYPSINS